MTPPELDLPTFLARHPWPAEWAALGRPLDYLWQFDLDADLEALWPQLIDTSRFNQRMGLPEMTFEERDGRLFGRSTNVGMTLEWEEIPWQWEHARTLSSARVYSRGFAKVVRAQYLLDDLGGGRSRLWVYFGWVPSGWFGRALLRIAMPRMEASYRTTLEAIVAELDRHAQLEALTEPPAHSRADLVRLDELERRLKSRPIDDALVERLVEHIRTADDHQLDRIQVRRLAEAWGADDDLPALTRVCLHASREGLLVLSWDVICPHCRGVRTEIKHLGEMQETGHCDVCHVDFETGSAESLEVTFRVHPAVRAVARRWYCAAEPSTKAHIKVQVALAPGERRELATRIGPGSYRLRIDGQAGATPLDIVEHGPGEPLDWPREPREAPLTVGPRPTLRLANDGAARRTYTLEARAPDRYALRPVDLFSDQEFRDLFTEQSIASGLQLDIGAQTIMFTDIVGSTRFYQEAGDASAFAEVRRHFLKTYELVKAHRGAVVKTIGDAAMAAFSQPGQALLAGLALQDYFREDNPETALRLRISIHTGPCLAVKLNSDIDYFGSAVNLAAKLQGVVESGQIVFTEPVRRDPDVSVLLEGTDHEVESLRFEKRWTADREQLPIYRIQVS